MLVLCGCRLLQMVALNDAFKLPLLEEGAVAAVFRCMARHPTPEVTGQCCGFFYFLADHVRRIGCCCCCCRRRRRRRRRRRPCYLDRLVVSAPSLLLLMLLLWPLVTSLTLRGCFNQGNHDGGGRGGGGGGGDDEEEEEGEEEEEKEDDDDGDDADPQHAMLMLRVCARRSQCCRTAARSSWRRSWAVRDCDCCLH